MKKVIQIIRKKPLIFVFLSLVYLLGVSFLTWKITPTWSTLWFFLGGIIGIYFMDIAEEVFAVAPSPFRNIIFAASFVLVSFFIVSSSGNAFATGLVLSLFLTILLWQIGERQAVGNLHRWYAMIDASTSSVVERWGMIILFALFLFETVIFIRS